MPCKPMQAVAESDAPASSKRTRSRSSGATWAAFHQFVKTRRAAVAVVTALAITVLVFAFGGLAEIVRTTYVGDTMNRAARAAARAVAFISSAALRV